MDMLLDTAAITTAIANAIQGAISTHVMEMDGITTDAKAVQARRDGEQVTREGTLKSLAEMSAAHGWTAKQVDSGAAFVASANNGAKVPASVKTFANELRVVMQPVTREAFPAIMQAAIDVWENENLLKSLDGKDAVMPAHKAWKRRYHTIVTATQALPTHGRLLNTPELIVAYANECDPDIDAGKAFKRIKAIREELSGIMAQFRHDDINAAYDDLAELSAETLAASRASYLASVAAAAATTVVAPSIEAMKAAEPSPAPASVVLDGPTTVVAETTVVAAPAPAPVSGVFNPLAAFAGISNGKPLALAAA
jgi:hypothetical protein